MRIFNSTPRDDNFRMPGEFERHQGCIMIWPVRPGSWPGEAAAAKKVFKEIAGHIAQSENMYMLTDSEHMTEAEQMLDDKVRVVNIETDDAWARDVCPTFVKNGHTGDVRGINWKFNAWGGDYDGLYKNWEKDDKAALQFCNMTGYDCYDANPFVLEGGSIHSDGEGTVIVTDSCLLSKGRNPDMSREQIEHNLKKYLGAKKIIWIPYGIYNDETNEHVDNVCAFTSPANVVLAWTDNEEDPQYAMSLADMKVLERETDARGRKFNVHKLHIPDVPVCITDNDLKGLVFEAGEDMREAGERLAASYANFYIANDIVLVPQFGDVKDKQAVDLIQNLMPEYEVIGVYARDIIVGGGNIHCITQQIPQ